MTGITRREGDYKGRRGVFIENGDFAFHVAGAQLHHVRVVYDKSQGFAYKFKRALATLNILLDCDLAEEMTPREYMEMVHSELENNNRVNKELNDL